MTSKQQAKSLEWDMRLSLLSSSWKTIARAIRKRVIDTSQDVDVRYLLVSGVELAKPSIHHEEANYHVHVAVVFHSPRTRVEALNVVVEDATIKDKSDGIIERWAKPRSDRFPYLSWRAHHVKLKTKDHDPSKLCSPFIIEAGDLPEDERTIVNRRTIISVVKKYAPELIEEVQSVVNGWTIIPSIRAPRARLNEDERLRRRKEAWRRYEAKPSSKEKKQAYDNSRIWKLYNKTIEDMNGCEEGTLQHGLYHRACRGYEKRAHVKDMLAKTGRTIVPHIGKMNVDYASDEAESV